jgi:hypothetical protein
VGGWGAGRVFNADDGLDAGYRDVVFSIVIGTGDGGAIAQRKMEGILDHGVVNPLVDLVVAEFVQAGEVAETAPAKGAEV